MSKHDTFTIYALLEDKTQKIRYVGLSKNPWRRYWQHIDNAEWIQEMLKKGEMPSLTYLEQGLTGDQAKEREKYWIHKLEGDGHVLENIVHNEAALRQREEDVLEQARLEKKFSHLPPVQARALIEITKGADAHLGHCAWEDALDIAIDIARELEKEGMLKAPVDEVEIAILTLRRWKLQWKREDEYREGKRHE